MCKCRPICLSLNVKYIIMLCILQLAYIIDCTLLLAMNKTWLFWVQHHQIEWIWWCNHLRHTATEIYDYQGKTSYLRFIHDDVIKWKHFPRYWPFMRGIHWRRWIPITKASDAWNISLSIETPVIWDAVALVITSLLCWTSLNEMEIYPIHHQDWTGQIETYSPHPTQIIERTYI